MTTFGLTGAGFTVAVIVDLSLKVTSEPATE